jgi:hypothetical protein
MAKLRPNQRDRIRAIGLIGRIDLTILRLALGRFASFRRCIALVSEFNVSQMSLVVCTDVEMQITPRAVHSPLPPNTSPYQIPASTHLSPQKESANEQHGRGQTTRKVDSGQRSVA